MKDNNWFVVGSLVLSLLQLSTLKPAGYETCQSEYIKPDTSCSNNCSQTGSATGENGGDGRSFFNCTVGLTGDFEKFLYENRRDLDTILFDSPTLESVSFYWKVFPFNIKEASLNFTFRLPKGLISPRWTLPEAVLLRFQSVQHDEYSDSYYYNCRVKRIFKFVNYTPSSFSELQDPRNISYDCIVGLDQTKPRLAYNLSLQTFKGRRVDYIVTVPIRSWTEEKDLWRPVVATRYDADTESVHVMTEQEPDWVKTLERRVKLVPLDPEAPEHAPSELSRQHARFDGIKYGEYYVNVAYPKCAQCEMSSFTISTKGLTNNGFLKEKQIEMSMVYIIAACLVGFGIVTATGCICWWRTRRNPLKKSLLRDADERQEKCLKDGNNLPSSENDASCCNEKERNGKYSPNSEVTTPKILLRECHYSIQNILDRTDSRDENGSKKIHDKILRTEKNNNRDFEDQVSEEEVDPLLKTDISPDMFSISSESSLWDSDSELCCRGWHKPTMSTAEIRQATQVEQSKESLNNDIVLETSVGTSTTKKADGSKDLDNIFQKMVMLNKSEETL